MDLLDLIFEAVDATRPNEDIIADIEQDYSSEDILAYRDEDEEEDVALIYVISLVNRVLKKPKALNLEFLAFLLKQGFDVNRPYPGTLMYNQRGYFLDFIKNKPLSLHGLSQLLVKELSYLDEFIKEDEAGVKQGIHKMMAVIEQSAGLEGGEFAPVQEPVYFGSITQALLGFGYAVTLPTLTVGELRELCLYAEGEASGAMKCVPGGDFSDTPEESNQALSYVSLFLGVVAASAEADMGGPMPVEIGSAVLEAFGSISSKAWDKVTTLIGVEAAGEMLGQPLAYYLTGNGPLTTSMLVTGELSDAAQPGEDFFIGMDQEQNQHYNGVSGKSLGYSDQGDMIPINAEALATEKNLFLIAAYD